MSTTTKKSEVNAKRKRVPKGKTHSKFRSSGKVEDKRTDLSTDDGRRLSATDRDNDPNWYFTSTDLASQAGELSIQEVLGNGPIIDEATIPTCAVVKLNPSPGVTYDMQGTKGPTNFDRLWGQGYLDTKDKYIKPESFIVNDGANLMAFKMYTLMSSFTGRTQQYGPQDLLLMILAISQVAAISEHIRRMFGMALTVNARNRALPKGMLSAMGIGDVDDFISHLADYRMRFNVQMTRINQVPLLDNVGFIRKCRDIYQKVYVDTDSSMAQNWFFAPYSTWVLDEQSSPQGSFLDTVDLSYSWKMSDWLNVLTSQIDAILTSSTMQIVYSDLINLANKVNVPTWQFDYLAENYVVLPEFNANAQLQFHNMDIVGIPATDYEVAHLAENALPEGLVVTPNNDVLQDPDNNRIIYNPGISCEVEKVNFNEKIYLNRFPHSTVVDFINPNPTLEDRIESLRFSCITGPYVTGYNSNNALAGALTYGMTLSDHYVVAVDMFTYPNNPRTQRLLCSDQLRPSVIGGTYYYKLADLTKFNDCFLLYDIGDKTIGSLEVRKVWSILGDFNFFTKVPFDYLNRTNRLMFTGLFDFRV